LSTPEIAVSTHGPVNDGSSNAENEYQSLNPDTVNVHVQQGEQENYQSLLRNKQVSHLIACRRHACVKSIVADPPIANKEEVVKARCKLQPIDLSMQV